ncbi:hypothetical protein [Priestia megaterium]|uniref:hypothetical protein n=1 Tax=Priestia megaterium TaxID=1404 RepID=UPI002E1B6C08|nr:suppressor of fused domain protein [Priestia megaterium]
MGYLSLFLKWKQKKQEKEVERVLEESISKRKAYWNTIGHVDGDVLTHLLNPMFFGGPVWPSGRQTFIRVQKTETVILASDGLSDPFQSPEEKSQKQGKGLEFYIECDDESLRGPLSDIQDHWAFDLLYQMSQNAAAHPNMLELFMKHDILSIEFTDLDVPPHFVNENGEIGVLLGIQSPSVSASLSLPYESIKLISMKLLTPNELEYVREQGAQGRRQLAETFQLSKSYHITMTKRESLI